MERARRPAAVRNRPTGEIRYDGTGRPPRADDPQARPAAIRPRRRGREVPGGFVSELLRENFVDVNFALIVLAQKA